MGRLPKKLVQDLRLPPEVRTQLQAAWYMKHVLNMTYEEIGKYYEYSQSVIYRRYFQRVGVGKVYRAQMDHCVRECGEASPRKCRDCQLYKFMVSRVLKMG